MVATGGNRPISPSHYCGTPHATAIVALRVTAFVLLSATCFSAQHAESDAADGAGETPDPGGEGYEAVLQVVEAWQGVLVAYSADDRRLSGMIVYFGLWD